MISLKDKLKARLEFDVRHDIYYNDDMPQYLCAERLAPIHALLLDAAEALQKILDAGNFATHGRWDATDEMKQIAYRALAALDAEVSKGE